MNKRMFALALAAAVTMIAVPAMAQDNFPDVPENHWAYEAIENLKREGILVGYPDGTFKGPRAATRYEMAVALNAAYQRLKNITDGLAEQIAEIRANMGTGDNKGLADRLAAVEAQLRGMSSLADDMAAMKRMAGEFQKELASLGVDVEAMKKDIDAMKKMGVVEPSIKISGDANIIMHAGVGDDGEVTYGWDGRIVGWDEQRNETTNSILGDMNIYHEIALNIDGNVSGGVKWGATMVYGNLMGGSMESYQSTISASSSIVTQGYGNQSGRFQGTAFGEGEGDMYISRLVVDLSDSLPFRAMVGRQGWKTENSYMYSRGDNTPYFENERWDNGKWITDGILMGWDFGTNTSLEIMGGRNESRLTTNGVEINPVTFSSINLATGAVDRFQLVQNTMGAQLKFGLGEKGAISLAYVFHGLSAFGEGVFGGSDRLETIGAGLNYNINDTMELKAGFSEATMKSGSTTTVGDDNTAWFARLEFKGDNFTAGAGYRRVDTYYMAPGDWDRLGSFFTPRNMEDFQIGAQFNVNENLKIGAEGIFGSTIAGDNDYSDFRVNADFGVPGGWVANLGWEQFTIDNNGSGSDPFQRWYTAGIRKPLGKDGLFKLVYQYGDHTLAPNGYGARGEGPTHLKGHILFGQVTVKF